MAQYKLKTFSEFKDFTKNDINLLPNKIYTHEQFFEIMKPVMCDLCRRLFNPTDEEKEEAKKNLEELKKISLDDFTWEVIIKH
jgi:hypothetical protein